MANVALRGCSRACIGAYVRARERGVARGGAASSGQQRANSQQAAAAARASGISHQPSAISHQPQQQQQQRERCLPSARGRASSHDIGHGRRRAAAAAAAAAAARPTVDRNSIVPKRTYCKKVKKPTEFFTKSNRKNRENRENREDREGFEPALRRWRSVKRTTRPLPSKRSPPHESNT